MQKTLQTVEYGRVVFFGILQTFSYTFSDQSSRNPRPVSQSIVNFLLRKIHVSVRGCHKIKHKIGRSEKRDRRPQFRCRSLNVMLCLTSNRTTFNSNSFFQGASQLVILKIITRKFDGERFSKMAYFFESLLVVIELHNGQNTIIGSQHR